MGNDLYLMKQIIQQTPFGKRSAGKSRTKYMDQEQEDLNNKLEE